MKPIKFHIDIKAQDCYLYAGHIFIVTSTGELIFTPILKLIKKFIEQYPRHYTFLRLVYLRNDYLNNNQAKYFLTIPDFKKTFDKTWAKFSKLEDILLTIDDSDFTFVDKIEDLPVYDIRAYAMRLYIATKKGLYEAELTAPNGYHLNSSRLRKVFDENKIVNINAKSGEIFASARSEGLFHGSILNDKNRLSIVEKPIASKSIKTHWSNYDICNYTSQNNFDYLVNEVIKEKVPINKYSKVDETKESTRFGKIGINELSMETLLESSKIPIKDILYCFNSATSGFFYLTNGDFYSLSLRKDSDEIHFSSRKKLMPQLKLKGKRPLSSSIIQRGCIVEFMDSIVLLQNNKSYNLENDSAFSVRSYMNSIRYKNSISIVKDNVITFHTLYPYIDENVSLKYEEASEDELIF